MKLLFAAWTIKFCASTTIPVRSDSDFVRTENIPEVDDRSILVDVGSNGDLQFSPDEGPDSWASLVPEILASKNTRVSRALTAMITLAHVTALPESVPLSAFSRKEWSMFQQFASTTAKYVDKSLLKDLQSSIDQGLMSNVDANVDIPLLKDFQSSIDQGAMTEANLSTAEDQLSNPAEDLIRNFRVYQKASSGCVVSFEGNKTKLPKWIRKGKSAVKKTDDIIKSRNKVTLFPESEEELISIIKNAPPHSLIPVGTANSLGYSLASTATGTINMISVWNFKSVNIDWCKKSLRVGGGVAVKDVASTIVQFNLTLPAWSSSKEVTFAGLVTNEVIGEMQGQPRKSISNFLREMTVINGKGERKVINPRTEEGGAWLLSLGALGMIVEMEFELSQDFVTLETVRGEDDDFKGLHESRLDYLDPLGKDVIAVANFDPLLPALIIYETVQRSYDTEDLHGYKGPIDSELDADAMASDKMKEDNQQIYSIMDRFTKYVMKIPGIKVRVRKFMKIPRSPKVQLRSASEAMLSTFAGDINKNCPLWLGIFLEPKDVWLAFKKLRKLRYKEKPHVWIRQALIMRAFTSDVNPALLGHEHNSTQFMIFSWSQPKRFERWATRYLCALVCELNITNIELSWSSVVPIKLVSMPEIKYPTKNRVERFKAIEAREDPDQKFTTALSEAVAKRLEPETSMCSYCSTV